jgi:cytochrome c5
MLLQMIGLMVYQRFVMKKLCAVVAMCCSAGAFAAPVPAKYQQSCFACHSTGVPSAPQTGDVAAWQPRLERGMDALVGSVKTGLNAMPPTGMCRDCSDEEYQALIEYMAAPAE